MPSGVIIDLFSKFRDAARDQTNLADRLPGLQEEFAVRAIFPADPATGALGPPDPALLAGTNDDVTGEEFAYAAMAGQLALIFMNTPQAALGGRTPLQCWRLVRST